jgi:hypothetical protein
MSTVSEATAECETAFGELCTALASTTLNEVAELMPRRMLENQYVRFRLWSASLDEFAAAGAVSHGMTETLLNILKELSAHLTQSKPRHSRRRGHGVLCLIFYFYFVMSHCFS